jgi:hypothetical protein
VPSAFGCHALAVMPWLPCPLLSCLPRPVGARGYPLLRGHRVPTTFWLSCLPRPVGACGYPGRCAPCARGLWLSCPPSLARVAIRVLVANGCPQFFGFHASAFMPRVNILGRWAPCARDLWSSCLPHPVGAREHPRASDCRLSPMDGACVWADLSCLVLFAVSASTARWARVAIRVLMAHGCPRFLAFMPRLSCLCRPLGSRGYPCAGGTWMPAVFGFHASAFMPLPVV